MKSIFKHQFSPWRKEYFKSKPTECVFCDIAKNPKNDDENFVLFRFKYCFCVMNRFPYTLGEFMIIPYEHIDNIENLDNETWIEMSKIAKIGVKLLKNAIKAQGVNIGMNLGDAAGAGISEHVHYHLVPRWVKDTNFITTVANTRVHGVPFADEYNILKDAFNKEFA